MLRRPFLRTLLATLAFGLTLSAGASEPIFTPLQQQQTTDNPGKIEVVEFFSYGCPHCGQLYPTLSAWAAKLPANVVLRKIPVSFGRSAWANLARIHYTLETLGELGRLEAAVFKAMQQRIALYDEKALREWLAKEGVNTQKFFEVYASFGIQSKVARGDQLSESYRLALPPALANQFGVPALFVDGRYLIGGRNFDDMLANATKMIERAQTERDKKY